MKQRALTQKGVLRPSTSDWATVLGKKYYSCLDVRHGFWAMPLDEDSKKFTAFGIKTSPGWFQRGMDRAFKSCNDFASIYIDDVNFGAHVKKVELH